MSHLINIRTTQNVFIQYPLASLGDRMLAYLVDGLILTAYLLACFFMFDYFDIYATWLSISIVTIPYLSYHLVFEVLMNGQSPGKKIMKIRVIRLDGGSPTLGNYLMRWMFRLIEVLLLGGALAIVSIALSSKGQRLGDVVAGTTVVKLVRQEEVTSQMIFANSVEAGYEPVFRQVTLLRDQDVEVIRQVLEVNRSTGNFRPVLAATEKLKNLLGIDSDLPPVQFLNTVVKDFNHLASQ
ncbi:MAG: RDD family protein [Bacteroidota bacterium]